MAFRINPLSALRLAGKHDRVGVGLGEFLNQLDGLVGVVIEDDDRQVGGDLAGAGRGLLVAGQDLGEPDATRSLPASRCNAAPRLLVADRPGRFGSHPSWCSTRVEIQG